MIDASTSLSPGWWFARLLKELGHRQDRYRDLDSRYRGDAPLPWGPEGCSSTFRRFQAKARANWASLIVEAVRDRQEPIGVRTGVDGDELGDEIAGQLLHANDFDFGWKLLNRAKLSMGDAYAIVGPGRAGGMPVITPEDPRQVITANDPVNRQNVLAALKVFRDDWTGNDRAYLYLPGSVVTATKPGSDGQTSTWELARWNWDGEAQRLPIPDVPVVRFANRADIFGRSLGEFEDVRDDLDRIDLMLLQRLTVAVMQAFRQRAIKGDLPDTDASGNPIDYNDVFRADPGALWQLPDGVDLWESGGVNLTPILESVKADVSHVAATTRTPMFYLFPDAANGSAEGASLQREGLIFKVIDRNVETNGPLKHTLSLAFRYMGDEVRASIPDMEILWAPPERFSLTERASAATQAQSAGVPWRTRMTDIMQFSPQAVARMETERGADALLSFEPTPAG